MWRWHDIYRLRMVNTSIAVYFIVVWVRGRSHLHSSHFGRPSTCHKWLVSNEEARPPRKGIRVVVGDYVGLGGIAMPTECDLSIMTICGQLSIVAMSPMGPIEAYWAPLQLKTFACRFDCLLWEVH
jgi:hypothetical protein